MKIYMDLADVPAATPGGTAVTIGNFDGVHRGHQALLAETVRAARQLPGPPCAMTFWPHPQAVLTGEGPSMIATLEQRTEWIREAGIEVLVIQTFDETFSRIEPEDFLDRLCTSLQPRQLILGQDFRFGYRGRGSLELAEQLADRHGYAVDSVAPVSAGGTTVSSSHIRSLLHSGDVRKAAELLGRPWQIAGAVTTGAGRGRTLGYPTVNVETNNELIVPDGVYGGLLTLADGTSRIAAISVGTNPTFGDEPRHAEAFLLDHDDPVEGAFRLDFRSYLRAQITFHDAAKLIAQMEADVQQIREVAEREAWLDRA